MYKPLNNKPDSKIREMIFNSLQHLLITNPKVYRKRMAKFVLTLQLTDQISTGPADLVRKAVLYLN
ncbi:MAG: hypothetical protein WEA56_07600 [Balneolaceae bacterium]